MTQMLEGLMQDDFPLTLNHIRRRLRSCNHGRRGGDADTADGFGRARDARRAAAIASIALARALRALGVQQGDRVGTFAWNNQRHFELYFAVPCTGAVLHTLNIRLFEEQLTYIVNHAEDRVIFVDESLVPLLAKLAPRFDTVARYVVMGDASSAELELPNAVRYEELLERGGRGRPVRVPRARRAPGGRALLHERHDRQPEGRALLAPLDQPALPATLMTRRATASRARTACWRWCRCSTPTRGGCPTARRSPARI